MSSSGSLLTIQDNLDAVKTAFFTKLFPRILNRGGTTESLIAMAEDVEMSSRLFKEEMEEKTATRCQRCCGKGRWLFWVFPCIMLCKRDI